jgi:hypothetical protein
MQENIKERGRKWTESKWEKSESFARARKLVELGDSRVCLERCNSREQASRAREAVCTASKLCVKVVCQLPVTFDPLPRIII